MVVSNAISVVLDAIDVERQALIDLCLTLGNARDYPGDELEVGEAFVKWFNDAGIEARLQFIDDRSVNAVAVLRGSGDRAGGGRSLVLNAHMDTQGGIPAGGPDVEQRLRRAWFADDRVYGGGLANDKAQLASEMIALLEIVKAGIRLKGDLIVTGVAQETTAPTVGEPQIARWSGVGPQLSQVREGHGSRWLIENGVVADYALVGEASDFTMTVAQAGYLRVRVTVHGNIDYTPGVRRGESPLDSPNPIERAAHVILALEAWARRYEQEHTLTFWGGTVIPKAQVQEIHSTGPAWTELEDHCHLYLDIRLAPGASAPSILGEVQDAVRSTGIPCEVTPYDYRRGYIAEGAKALIDALKEAHQRVLGDELRYAAPRMISMWRDGNAFNESGIPAIGYGPPRDQIPAGAGSEGAVGSSGASTPMRVDDLIATAKVFALTALTVCKVEE